MSAARPPASPVAPAGRPALVRDARRRPGRRPARARDLHAPARLARPGDRARLAAGRRQARGDGDPQPPRRPHPDRATSTTTSARPPSSARSTTSSPAASASAARRRRSRRLKPDEAKALVLKAQGLSYAEIGERLRLDLHEGEPLHHRGPRPLPQDLRGARGGRGVRALRADARVARRRHGRRGRDARAPPAPPQLPGLPRDRPRPPRDPPRPPPRPLADPGAGRAAALARPRPRRARPAPMPTTPAPRRRRPTTSPVPDLGPDDLEPVDLSELYDAVERIDPHDAPRRRRGAGRWLELKAHALRLVAPAAAARDVVTATQISAGTGGGRIATLGAVIGLCLSGLGAGTVCVVTGVIELPRSRRRRKSAPATEKAAKPASTPEPKTAPRREPKRPLPIAATPTPTPTAGAQGEPARREPRRDARRERSPRRRPAIAAVAHETPAAAPGRGERPGGVHLRASQHRIPTAVHDPGRRARDRRRRVRPMSRARPVLAPHRLGALRRAALAGDRPRRLLRRRSCHPDGVAPGWVAADTRRQPTAYIDCGSAPPPPASVPATSSTATQAPRLHRTPRSRSPRRRAPTSTGCVRRRSQRRAGLASRHLRLRATGAGLWCGTVLLHARFGWRSFETPLHTTRARAVMIDLRASSQCGPDTRACGSLGIRNVTLRVQDPVEPALQSTAARCCRGGWLRGVSTR